MVIALKKAFIPLFAVMVLLFGVPRSVFASGPQSDRRYSTPLFVPEAAATGGQNRRAHHRKENYRLSFRSAHNRVSSKSNVSKIIAERLRGGQPDSFRADRIYEVGMNAPGASSRGVNL